MGNNPKAAKHKALYKMLNANNLPEYIIADLYEVACMTDPTLNQQWTQACAAGCESFRSRNETLCAIANALAHAKFLAESEDAYFQTNVESILACCTTPLQQKLANAILQFDSESASQLNRLIGHEHLQWRMRVLPNMFPRINPAH